MPLLKYKNLKNLHYDSGNFCKSQARFTKKRIENYKKFLHIYTAHSTTSQKANQQRHHHINVPTNPHGTISHVGKSVFNVAKIVTANGNTIANAIVKSSKLFLTVVLTDAVTGYLTSIRPLQLSLELTS